MFTLQCHLLPRVNGICLCDRVGEGERCCLKLTPSVPLFVFYKILFSVSTFYFSPSVRFLLCFFSPFCLLRHSCIPFFTGKKGKHGGSGAIWQPACVWIHRDGQILGQYALFIPTKFFLGIFTNFKRKSPVSIFEFCFSNEGCPMNLGVKKKKSCLENVTFYMTYLKQLCCSVGCLTAVVCLWAPPDVRTRTAML